LGEDPAADIRAIAEMLVVVAFRAQIGELSLSSKWGRLAGGFAIG
jgi:hypothetical protein